MTDIIYNVTVNVSDEVHLDWVEWMKTVHIPELLQCGLFSGATFVRVHAFEQGGTTYAVQYACRSMEDLERYQRDFGPGLREKTEKAFGDHVHAFRTTLEVLARFKT
jgi:hypothetical protein